MGWLSGSNNQADRATAYGVNAGKENQEQFGVAVGANAGQVGQSAQAVAVGGNAAQINQGSQAVAVGVGAGTTSQGLRSVAIGAAAANQNQGENSIAIGYTAGQTNQPDNSFFIGVACTRNDSLAPDPTPTNNKDLCINEVTGEIYKKDTTPSTVTFDNSTLNSIYSITITSADNDFLIGAAAPLSVTTASNFTFDSATGSFTSTKPNYNIRARFMLTGGRQQGGTREIIMGFKKGGIEVTPSLSGDLPRFRNPQGGVANCYVHETMISGSSGDQITPFIRTSNANYTLNVTSLEISLA